MKSAEGTAKGLRKGFSTGSTSAAVVRASIKYYFDNKKFNFLEIKMPAGESAVLKVSSLVKFRLDPDLTISKAVLTKDSGDDSADVTGGIEICADFTAIDKKNKNAVKILKKYYENFSVYNIIKCPLPDDPADLIMFFVSSKGIGIVKRKGLPLRTGFPAINPVPLKMIESAAYEELKLRLSISASNGHMHYAEKIFFSILYVPEGEKIAEQTLNPRLGIEGGISILGTSGYVVPISTKAWLETIKACLNFLKANKIDTCVLTPGRFSEKAALKIFKNLQRESFIEIGDYVSYSLRKVSGSGIKNIIFAGQFGKIVKIAQGARNTNAKYTSLDLVFLARIAQEAVKKSISNGAEAMHIKAESANKKDCSYGCNDADFYKKGELLYGLIVNSNTSREAFGYITSDDFKIYSDGILSELLKKAAENLYNIVKNAVSNETCSLEDKNAKEDNINIRIKIVLIDYGGNAIKKERL